jgi:hypothetical protein
LPIGFAIYAALGLTHRFYHGYTLDFNAKYTEAATGFSSFMLDFAVLRSALQFEENFAF